MNGFQKERPRHDSDVEFNRRGDGDALGARASGQARGQKMRVLIACEESQEVCKAFRKRGHEAYSCDIQKPSGGHPEWHILGDALKVIEGGRVVTMDGQAHDVGRWDMLIAHPPCTYLSNVATRHISLRCNSPDKVVNRWEKRARAAIFFM